jgi:hypothetical protein
MKNLKFKYLSQSVSVIQKNRLIVAVCEHVVTIHKTDSLGPCTKAGKELFESTSAVRFKTGGVFFH